MAAAATSRTHRAPRAPWAIGITATVTAGSLVRNLALLVDKIDPSAVADDMLVTLLRGEQVTFTVTSTEDIALERFAQPDVLRTANQLVADWA